MFKYGVLPTSFSKGMLVPLFNKPTISPSVPNKYRPLTISSSMSKILELHVLDECAYHNVSDLQFGFVAGRETDMAASLTKCNDVISLSTKRGSPVYTCSLDAEEAFDVIPYSILFDNAIYRCVTGPLLVDGVRR